jgi:hypothetical protein
VVGENKRTHGPAAARLVHARSASTFSKNAFSAAA